MMPIFKELLTTDHSESEGKPSSATKVNRDKTSDVERLNDVLVLLVFYNDREWFERDDSWVAECLDEWVDPSDEQLFNSSLREDAGKSELEMFLAAFDHVVERWRTESEQAKPQPNPDFDPDEPVEGTQYYKYAKSPGTQHFEWLYASAENSVDWQPMQVRYDQYEAEIDARQGEVKPYGEYFMKPVDGGWQYGARPDTERWYRTYEELLAAQAEPYGDYFMRLVNGEWRFGATRHAEVWYGKYDELLESLGLSEAAEEEPEEPAAEKPKEPAADGGLDPRVVQPESKLTEAQAHEILATPAGKQFVADLEQQVFEQHRDQLEQLLAGTEDLSEAELTKLLELAQQKSI
jgi:hypothetical protein